ncbi:MAG: hypothetical protein K8F62_11195 [Pseudorhodoplanes sp.]|nr:hypothetical protein [Pseudorhodoplanes sp.]
MITFRKTLMATTMLVGLAIFATDAAQAGPNGGPSLGSISGFSSMRMDFNRVGGPNRALSRDDMRVVPLEIKKSDKGARKDEKKSAAKKGINTARVSNPKSASGGKGKESLADRSGPRIPAPLAELYRVTGGNLDDISRLAELIGWLKTGLPAAGDVLFPKPGDGTFVPLTLGGGQGDKSADRYWAINGWHGSAGAPGGPDTSKTGWAGIWIHDSTRQGQGHRVSTYHNDETGATATVESYWRGSERQRIVTVRGRDDAGNPTTDHLSHDNSTDSQGNSTETRVEKHTSVEDGMLVTDYSLTVTDKDGNIVEAETNSSAEPYNGNDPEKQPVEEGTGRPGRTGWCSPTGGCVTGSVVQDPRIIPASDYSTPEMRSQLPSWATDPCPDCTSRGGGSGYSGYNPQNEGSGDVDGEGGRRTPM